MKNSTKCILYFFGQLGLMLQLRFFFQWILEFYKVNSELSLYFLTPAFVGVVLLLFRIGDALFDPIVGVISDRLLLNGTPRTTCMKCGIPLISLGLILSFSPTIENKIFIQHTILYFSLFFFFIGYSLYCIPFWALIDDLSENNTVLSASLSSALGIGIFLASAISFVVTPILISFYGYLAASVIVSFISLLLMCMPLLIEQRPISSKTSTITAPALSILISRFFIPLKDKQFLLIVFLLGAIQASFTILTALSGTFVEYVIHLDKTYTVYLMAPVIGTGVCAFFFLSKIIKCYDPIQVTLFFVFAQGLLFTLCYPVYLIFNREIYLVVYAILFGFFGIPVAVILAFEALLVKICAPSSSDIGLYFGSFNFLIKTVNGIAIMITGVVLTYTDKTKDFYIPIFLTGCGFCILLISFFTKYAIQKNLQRDFKI